MILYTKNADTNILLGLLKALSSSDTITCKYTEYMHHDDHLAVLELVEYNKVLVNKNLENYEGITIVAGDGTGALNQVVIAENKKHFNKLLGDNGTGLSYNNSGLVLPDNSILLHKDVCVTNLMGKIPEKYNLLKIVSAYYIMAGRD